MSTLMPPRRRQPQRHFEAVVDEPLERRQRADHQDPDRQPVPQAPEADVAVDSRHGFAAAFAG